MGVVHLLVEGLLSSEMETELTNLRAGLDAGLGSGFLPDDSPFSCCLFVISVLLLLLLLLFLLLLMGLALLGGGCGLDVAFTGGNTPPWSSSESPSSSTLAPPSPQASAASSSTSFCRLSVSMCLILRFSSRTRSISTKSSCICSTLLSPWDVSRVESVPEVLSSVGDSLGVGLKSTSGSLALFTLLLFSLSTSSSSSLVHWRASRDKADQFFRLMDILGE